MRRSLKRCQASYIALERRLMSVRTARGWQLARTRALSVRTSARLPVCADAGLLARAYATMAQQCPRALAAR